MMTEDSFWLVLGKLIWIWNIRFIELTSFVYDNSKLLLRSMHEINFLSKKSAF